MRQRFWSPLLAVCVVLNACIHAVLAATHCPTLGISSYALVVIKNDTVQEEFVRMLEVFANTTSQCSGNFVHHLYFGDGRRPTSEKDQLYDDIQKWVDSGEINEFHMTSKANTTEALVAYNSIQKMLEEENHSATAVRKKAVTIITDFIDKDLFEKVNNLNETNSEVFVQADWNILIGFEKNYTNMKPLLTIGDKTEYCDTIRYERHTSHKYAKANINIYLTAMSDASTTGNHVATVLDGDKCSLPGNDVMSDYATVYYGKESVSLPWVGNETIPFAKQCVNSLYQSRPVTKATRIRAYSCKENPAFYDSLLNDLFTPTNLTTFNVVIGDDLPDCFISMISSAEKCPNCTNIYLDVLIDSPYQNQLQVYSHVYKPLSQTHMFSAQRDNHVTTSAGALTACRQTHPAAPLQTIGPYVPPKSLSRALERFFLLILIATTSVTATGAFFYRRMHRKRMELLEEMREMSLNPGVFKKAKECPKVARLPWEIKSDRIHLDYEFPLGEGTISVVYLGKLKGKSPIMQWIDRVEMKQFQDCPVAVRVPRRFDEVEERQLLREINSMKVLKNHTHINVLLGWTSKDNLVCTVLELTHTSLSKYLSQIRDGVTSSVTQLTASLIPYRHFLQISWQICDALTYITSKGLVHRDVAARNVLLTTGLRAKVSGFGFCSESTDPAFAPGADVINALPVRWLAPEAMEGRFSEFSDIWSFGITLDEMYSLGDTPYGEMQVEEFVQAIKCGERLRNPEFASDDMYNIMIRCWHKYPERRPRFAELQEKFQSMIEHYHDSDYHDNEAFELNEN